LLKTRRQRVDHVEFSPKGALLAHGEEEVVCWETPIAGDLSYRVPTRYTWGAAFTGIDNWFALSNSHGVSFLRPSDGRREQLPGVVNRVYTVVAARGGVFFLHQTATPLIALALGTNGVARRLWEIPDDHFPSRPTSLNTQEQFVRFESRRRQGGRSPQLVIRHLKSGEVADEWQVQMSTQSRTALSPDDRWLAYPNLNTVVILDLPTRRAQSAYLLTKLDGRHFTGLAFHPSGRFLAATSNDATVKLYDTSNWSLATTYTWDIGRMRSVAFSPDGLLAAAGSDTGKVVVWDVDV